MKLSLLLVCLLVASASTARISSARMSGSKRVHALKRGRTQLHKDQVFIGAAFDELFEHLTNICISLNRGKYERYQNFAYHMISCQNYTARFYEKAVKCQTAGPAADGVNRRWVEEEMKSNKANGDDLCEKKAAAIRNALLFDPANKAILVEAEERFSFEVGLYNQAIMFDWVAWTDKPATDCA